MLSNTHYLPSGYLSSDRNTEPPCHRDTLWWYTLVCEQWDICKSRPNLAELFIHSNIHPILTGLSWCILGYNLKGYEESIPLIEDILFKLSMRTYCMPNSDRVTL